MLHTARPKNSNRKFSDLSNRYLAEACEIGFQGEIGYLLTWRSPYWWEAVKLRYRSYRLKTLPVRLVSPFIIARAAPALCPEIISGGAVGIFKAFCCCVIHKYPDTLVAIEEGPGRTEQIFKGYV